MPRTSHRIRLFILMPMLVALMALAGCGGGDGARGDGAVGEAVGDLRISATSIAFEAFASESTQDAKTLMVTWSNPKVAGVVVGVPPGQSLPPWLHVSAQGSSSPLTLVVTRVGTGPATGRFTTTLRAVSGDTNLNVIDTVDFQVTLDVVAAPVVSPAAVNVSWVESQQLAEQTLTVTSDSRSQFVSASVDANWLNVSTSGGVLKISGNEQSRALPPGSATARLNATYSLGGRQRVVSVPINATITAALQGPTQLSYEVNASTTAADLLNKVVTVTSVMQGSLLLNAQTNVPWLTAGNATTGTQNNLSLSLQSAEIQQLKNGTYNGRITLTSAAANVTPLTIPVALTVRLPEVHYVAPVAFTDTVATDYVYVRGEGFNDPSAEIRIDGQPTTRATVLNDTTIKLVAGARPAGDYSVRAINKLGYLRDVAKLRVTDPPAYANFTMTAPVELQERVLPSPINHAVFTSRCYFCAVGGGAGVSTVTKFTYDPGSRQWSRVSTPFTKLVDIALSPDESELLVLTSTELLRLDPVSMAVTGAITFAESPVQTSRAMAVTNSGQVLVYHLRGALSLRTGTFRQMQGLVDVSAGLDASRDGSRVMMGKADNPGAPYRYYDSITDEFITASTLGIYGRGAATRHAQKAFVSDRVLDQNLATVGTLPIGSFGGDISPDGLRAYGLDLDTHRLRTFDLTTAPFTELAPIQLTDMGAARVAVDPRGNAVFVVGEAKFIVVDVR
jgi:hypothetical protein